jgi:TM2 domain-containing membrane protein YozV
MSSMAASMPRVSTSAGRQYSVLAAVLSYLIPGLGQIYQGRIVKGLLFFVCIYALFFYGMYLGSGTYTYADKVYSITSNVYLPDTADNPNSNPFGLYRPLANLYNRPQFAGQFWIGIAAWPAIWQYLTFDKNADTGGFPFGRFQRTPTEEELNVIHNHGDHFVDLGWVYTVIAGVLNIMVIYDAFAGPAFLSQGEAKKER